MASVSETLRHFCSVCTVLWCPNTALLDDDTVEGLDRFSLTLGEACVLTCVDEYVVAGDAEITMTCIFDLELTSKMLEASTGSCQWALGDLSTLMPPFLVNHDCPKTVFGKSWIMKCPSGPGTMSGSAAFTALTGSADGALVREPTLPHPTCEALMCSIGDLLLNGSLFGPDWTSWTMGESCAVTCAEGYQTVNETGGTLTRTDDEVAGEEVLEVAVPKCLSIVCSHDDPSTGVRHEGRDKLYQGSCGATCTEGHEVDGSISTSSLRLSSGEFVNDAPTVDPSCSQMPCSDTLTQSGFGVNSSCGGASIGDAVVLR